ncbi:CDP-glycerol glycerophosphotransferase family protein [Salinicoccus albus]|uniref:CDP-glycerol glycerophosphotransferase family protein n=1 Tax=Salinicoccus albus TaxID=418756 RepID=UPI000374D241|nr:CDP-glycerol glycerophosphotransferase family protein [Salinicoccus albus]
MAKDIVVNLYVFVSRVIFTLCSVFPVQHKTVMIASFGDNIQFVMDEVQKRTSSKIIVLRDHKCRYRFEGTGEDNCINFKTSNIPGTLRGIYHLATSEFVFVDNYQVVLAACNFKDRTTCIQLWHANGAVKLFGFKDKNTIRRTAASHRRFKKVYSRFHKIVVSSDHMGAIFEKAFDAGEENLLKTGIPRTDFFYSQGRMDRAAEKMQAQMPQLRGRKVMLYAPTFRDKGSVELEDIKRDVQKLEQAFSDEYHLLLRVHPSVRFEGYENNSFATNVSYGQDIFELLAITDLLITDYSSIPFEFAILGRPMVFFAYDLKAYEASPGIWFDYETFVPGPVVYTAEEMIDTIRKEDFKEEKILLFDETWNKYADGWATEKLVKYLYEGKQQEAGRSL